MSQLGLYIEKPNINFALIESIREQELLADHMVPIKDPEDISSFLKYHTSGSYPMTTCCTQCWNQCCLATYIQPLPPPFPPPRESDGDGSD